MKYTFRPNLFVTKNGKPMVFYVNSATKKEKLAKYIKCGGGTVADSSSGPYTITIVDSDYTPNSDDNVFSCNFIETSCKRNLLPSLRPFMKNRGNNRNDDFNPDEILQQNISWSVARHFKSSKENEGAGVAVECTPEDGTVNFPEETNNSLVETTTRAQRMRTEHDEATQRSESSVESLSESNSWSERKHARRNRRVRRGQPFSNSERKNIMQYIIQTKSFDRVGGVTLWQEMEKKKVCPGRTWQSLKEHYRKNILKNINFYGLSDHVVQNFKKRRRCTSPESVESTDSWMSKPYDDSEDKVIVLFVMRNKLMSHVERNATWKVLERKNLLKDRSWSSMKERFFKHIVNRLESYGINSSEAAGVKEAFSKGIPETPSDRKSLSPVKNQPSSQEVLLTPQVCLTEGTQQKDSENIPLVRGPVTCSSQVTDTSVNFTAWSQCTPEEIIMEDLSENSGDISDGNDKDKEKDGIGESCLNPCSCISSEEGGEHENIPPGPKPHNTESALCSTVMYETATPHGISFEHGDDWSDDGLYWHGNVYRFHRYPKNESLVLEKDESDSNLNNSLENSSEELTHHNSPKLCKNLDTSCMPYSNSCSLDNDAKKCKGTLNKQNNSNKACPTPQAELSCAKNGRNVDPLQETAVRRSERVEQWLQSSTQCSIVSGDLHPKAVKEKKRLAAENEDQREMADQQLSYSKFNFLSELTLENIQEPESITINKPSSPPPPPSRVHEVAVQTDPVHFCNHRVLFDVMPQQDSQKPNSSQSVSPRKVTCTRSEDSPPPSPCSRLPGTPCTTVSLSSGPRPSPRRSLRSSLLGTPTSTITHSSEGVRSPQGPSPRNFSRRALSLHSTQGDVTGVRSPRPVRILPPS